jgi:hypothetical protein
LFISWATVCQLNEASEGRDVDDGFNPQHDESSKKSPGVRGWCLFENLIHAGAHRSEKSESPAAGSGAGLSNGEAEGGRPRLQ